MLSVFRIQILYDNAPWLMLYFCAHSSDLMGCTDNKNVVFNRG